MKGPVGRKADREVVAKNTPVLTEQTIFDQGSYEDSSSGNGGSEKRLTISHFLSIFFFLISAYVVTSAIFLAEKCFPPKKLNLVENFNSDNLDDE